MIAPIPAKFVPMLLAGVFSFGCACRTVQAQPDEKATLSYIDAEIDLLVVARPAMIMKSKSYQELKRTGGEYFEKTIKRLTDRYYKFSLAELDEIDQVIYAERVPVDGSPVRYTITVVKTLDDHLRKFELIVLAAAEEFTYKNLKFYRTNNPLEKHQSYVWIADNKTVVYSPSKAGIQSAIDAGKKEPLDAYWFEHWELHRHRQLSIVVGKDVFKQIAPLLTSAYRNHVNFKAFSNIKLFSGEATIGSNTRIKLNAICEHVSEAKEVKSCADQCLEIGWKWVQAQQKRNEESGPEFVQTVARSLIKAAEVSTMGKEIEISSNANLDLQELKPLFKNTYLNLKRNDAATNLNRLATAFHAYHDAKGTLPPSVFVSPSGKKHSWRIAILPYIGEEKLYYKYRFDEDWDSKHNLEVTKEMPDVFRSDVDDSETTSSSWFLLTGAQGAINDTSPLTLKEISKFDGTRRTILIVEAKRNMHWAKPEDIRIDFESRNFPTLGGYHVGGFNIALADGSIYFVDKQIRDELLWSFYTVNGGEEFEVQDMSVLRSDR
jgi:hypothetical protein